MNGIKNILLIGRTGGGKSTLANTLINQNNNFEEVFKESAGSVSETKQVQIKEFIVNITEDGSERVRYLIIDTAGFGDTKLTDKEVLELMSELVKIVGDDGLIQIFFVTNSRFTKEEIDVYQLLESVIFDNQVNEYTSIIKTKFPEFEDETKCEADRQNLRGENPELSRIFNVSKIIYVDNPPLVGRPAAVELNKETRGESRKRLLTHLGRCQSVYQPSNLNTLNQRINNYKTQKENLQKEISNLNNQISQAESNHWYQIQSLENRQQQEIRALEGRRQDELRQIRNESDYGYITNEIPYWTIEYSGNESLWPLKDRKPYHEWQWVTITNKFSFLENENIPFKHYEKQEAKKWLERILENLTKRIGWIEIRDSLYSEPKIVSHKDRYWCNINLFSDDQCENGLFVKLYDAVRQLYFYEESHKRGEELVMQGIFGIKYHPHSEYVDWKRALKQEIAGREANLTQQIERIKQENRDRENRLWQEIENQRRLNEQRIAQERQSIQANLDSTRQNSQARIAYAQQQINNAERDFEQQVQQQTNLPVIAGLAGMIAKMFI